MQDAIYITFSKTGIVPSGKAQFHYSNGEVTGVSPALFLLTIFCDVHKVEIMEVLWLIEYYKINGIRRNLRTIFGL